MTSSCLCTLDASRESVMLICRGVKVPLSVVQDKARVHVHVGPVAALYGQARCNLRSYLVEQFLVSCIGVERSATTSSVD